MIVQEDDRDRSGQDLATSTLAEIYAQQGLLERARAIYERIAQRSPGDPRIAERIDTLTRAIQERGGETPVREPAATGPHDPPAEDDPTPVGEVRADEAGARETRDEVFEAWLASR